MRAKPVTITLGEREYIIRPLTLGQVEQIEPYVSKAEHSSPVSLFVNVIQIALQRDYPEVNLRDLEVGAWELSEEYTKVLMVGGFIRSEDSGEAASPEAAG